MNIPDFSTKKERIDFLIENKDMLIAEKKASMKMADAISFDTIKVDKANNPVVNPPDVLNVEAAINTTNIIDSHMDLHLPGIWNKSIKENKMIMHLQEHQMKFGNIISDGKDLRVKAEKMSWVQLGYPFEGNTEVLLFNSKVRKERNPFMHNEYAKGNVKNHSVGMMYVKLFLAVNDEGYVQEFENWEKYIGKAVNPEIAEEKGYFWAVKEAKVIEGSAVPLGSNYATPTTDNNKEPLNSTQDKSTQSEPLNYIINNFKL